MKYRPTIGLEIHAELKTKTKMFCDSLNDPDEKHPNVNVCPICMGHPGTLPVINKKAVEYVLKVGLALGSVIPEWSKFDRKNYFYPDLPKGYQISQYDQPLCRGGALEFPISNFQSPNESQTPNTKRVKIQRIHLEEDTGKLIHPEGAGYSLVDFNRAGVPLMELVTEPDMHSAEEARAFAEELQLLLRYLGVSYADMEKGQLRLEANVSVSLSNIHEGAEKQLGTKVEVKNLNSFRAVEEAIKYEIERQIKILEKGGRVTQETRGWDDVKKVTYSQRWKEEAQDYRYFPEPDLPPLYLGKSVAASKQGAVIFDLEALRRELPELPWEKRKRFKEEYGLSPQALEPLIRERQYAKFFEEAVSELEAHDNYHLLKHKREELVKLLYNYLMSDLRGLMMAGVGSTEVDELRIKPEHFAHLIVLTHQGKISSRTAKDVLKRMFETGEDPETIIREKELTQVSDEHELGHIIGDVVKENQKAVQDYLDGKMNALQFLIGQTMAKSRGRANPKTVEEILKRLLAK